MIRGPDLDRDHRAVPGVKDLAMLVVAAGCLTALVLGLFGPVLFADRQFAFRDASQTYYPLYRRIQEAWAAGRWPLWMDEANGGVPLLGNPISAVLYPGKLVYSLLPYAWAARVYVIVHVLLAFAAMVALLRSWGMPVAAAAVGGLSYAFSGPVLFQYANVIFLVGASWMPLGLLAIDRWLRYRARPALIGLAGVLSMQVLGGDLESAYLLGVAGAVYCVGLACGKTRPMHWVLLVVGLVAFYALEVWLATHLAWLSRTQPPGSPVVVGHRRAVMMIALLGLGLVVALLVKRKRDLARGLSGLAAAGLLALALTAAQVWPTVELASQSVRAINPNSQDIYAYSFRPARMLEWAWPNVSGTLDRGNTRWLETLPRRYSEDFWIPSAYLGGLALVLACGAAGIRDGPPWRIWLAGLALVGILGSMGEYASPLFWTRPHSASVAVTGPSEPPSGPAVRTGGQLTDGDGGFYWLLTVALPGFGSFRYPEKLLTIATLGLAGLAALGWHRVTQGRTRRCSQLGLAGLAATLCALGFLALAPATAGGFLTGRVWIAPSAFGPLDVSGALSDIRTALIHAALVLFLSIVLIRLAPRRPRSAGALALVLVALDLIAADRRIIWTVPQSLFDKVPRLVEIIEEAERSEPSQGPFRIHRMGIWQPLGWFMAGSEDRHEEMLRWQRDTLMPLHAVTPGIDTISVRGPAELVDFALLFEPSPRGADRPAEEALKLKPGAWYVSYPRQSFNLWNTRYFVLPGRFLPTDLNRGFATFLPDTEVLYPDLKSLEGPASSDRRTRWLNFEDVQVLRNKAAFPRAWVVHQARMLKPSAPMDPEAQGSLLRRLTRAGTRAASPTAASENDLRKTAWIETDHPEKLTSFLPSGQPQPKETVTVDRAAPERVELTADLQAPGVVVLADVYYPGWELTIDGERAEILRVNRMMRGAAVGAGSHRLVYAYFPPSFRLGMMISLATLAALVLLGGRRLARALKPRRE
jgi:hypothetical protein